MTSETQETATIAEKQRTGRDTRFKKGDPKPPNSGRKKGTVNGSTQEAMKLCEENAFNPIEAAIVMAQDERRRDDIRLKAETRFTLHVAMWT